MRTTNKYIQVTMLIQLCLSVTAATLTCVLSQSRGAEMWYLYPDGDVNEYSLPVAILV